MFKLFFVYPFILLVCFWLASDVEVNASLYKLKDNKLSIHFPKASLRDEGSEPWIDIYWGAEEASNVIEKVKKEIY